MLKLSTFRPGCQSKRTVKHCSTEFLD